MGCVTSKVMTRTGSFREELNRSLKKRYEDFPALHKLLISTSRKHDGDRFVVASEFDEKDQRKCDGDRYVVASSADDEKEANKVESKRLDHETIINMWELMSDLEEEQAEKSEEDHTIPVDGTNHTIKRSRSFCPSLDHAINEYGVHNEEKNDVRVRSRSFHTVDEYDAILMERNGWTHCKQEREWEDKLEDFLTNVTKVPCEAAQETRESEHTTDVSPIAYKPGFIFEIGTKTDEDEKGVRRMRRAKDLTSLAIPCTIEFPVVASEEYSGQLLICGNYDYYATPKFGSFDVPIQSYICGQVEKEKQKCVFDPELLSSFEVAMEQLQVEEEFLLNQINTKSLCDSGMHGTFSS